MSSCQPQRNIETSYYETKTFWSFRNYMVRSVKGIKRLTNLTCISYAVVRLLPYYDKEYILLHLAY